MKQAGRGRSAREIRRMMERREQKEQNERRIKQFWALPEEQRKEILTQSRTAQRLQQNGITLQDVREIGQKEYRNGYREGSDNALMTCYAGVCMALNKLYGFGKKRCLAVLRALDEQVLYSLTGAETAQEVFDRLGLTIAFGETFPEDRITEKEEGKSEKQGEK